MSLKMNLSFLISAFFLSSCLTATPNLQVVNGETRMTLTQSAPISRGADISPDGKYLLTGGLNVFSHWDISRGLLINRYEAQLPEIMGTLLTTGIIPVAFASNGRYALSGGEELKLWDLSSGKAIRTIGDDPAATIGVSSDGQRVLTCKESEWALGHDKLNLYDVKSGEKMAGWDAASGQGAIIVLSPDGKYALTTAGGGRKSAGTERGAIHLWDVSSGELLRDFAGTGDEKGVGAAVLAIAFSPDGKHALSGGTDGSVRLWNISTGEELKSIKGHEGWVGTKAVSFSPDGKTILSVGGSDGLAKLWDISSGSLIRSFKVSDDHFVALRRFGGLVSGWVAFTPDGKRIVYMGSDASFRIFETATGSEIATLVEFDDGQWLVVTAEGYYNASEKGAQYLKVQYGGKDYGVDQFYDVFYRPDMVAAKLSGQDITGLASLTMREASKTPPPAVTFTTAPANTDQAKVKVCYQARNTGGGIGEVRLFHNGKLIQSDGYYRDMAKTVSEKPSLMALNSKAIYDNMRSVSLKAREVIAPVTNKPKGDIFEDCREVEVVPGENEMSVSAFNGNNTVQSYMKTVKFNAAVKPQDPHLYILAIGIDRYRDKAVNLKYAVKDATDIERKLLTQSATIYKPQNIHYELLTDMNAGKENIINKIDGLARVIRPDDGFILFAAGHGLLLQNQYYMLTADYNGTVSDSGTISSNEIVEMSKKIKSLSQLFIFDTCHAGGMDSIVGGLYDARMSVLAKKMGLHIYASANSMQEAQDGYLGNGLFTYTLLDGLNNKREADRNNDGKISLVELGEYGRQATIEISKKTGRNQTPLIINFGKDSPVYNLR
ncbi:MAG: caspase family protein [Syntrophales bacterium]|nr:caspase family protein [Syntrophales bacterium]